MNGYKEKETPLASCLTIETVHSPERTCQKWVFPRNITPFVSNHAKTVSKALRPSQRRDNAQQLETEYEIKS